nr:hypothetical protein [Tanacetum cinerariifolium]
TKACYLQEVIPFFKTLKDNFEGIQKALTKEVKEMKDVFEELEAEVAQYAIDRKHDAIELKNVFIANDNLTAECLSQEVFCVATGSCKFREVKKASPSRSSDRGCTVLRPIYSRISVLLVLSLTSWDCQVGFGGEGGNRTRLGCLVAARIGQVWGVV